MSKSKRACCVVFTATMLALASPVGAVGQATTTTAVSVGGEQAKAAPQTTPAPAERVRKGHVVGNAGNARQSAPTPASDPACAAGTEASRSASCPKGINQAGLPVANAAELEPPAAPPTAERIDHGGIIKGNVVIASGSAKQAKSPEAVEPACMTKAQDGRPTSCPKGITESGIK